ncbi:MAG TPA: hypothetical protein VH912_14805 [Streptosporangiaceae bacterium]|jgi:hypothetical protein
MRRRTATCESETADDFDCTKRATRIGEWAAEGQPMIRIPMCRAHARQKARVGWRVWRASREELRRLADERADGEAP